VKEFAAENRPSVYNISEKALFPISAIAKQPVAIEPREPGEIAIVSPDTFRGTIIPWSGPALQTTATSKKRRRFRPYPLSLSILIITVCLTAGYYESQTSKLQAKYIAGYAAKLQYHVEEGESSSIVFPKKGPYDKRLGYVQLPTMLDKLKRRGMEITSQARFSPDLGQFASHDLYIPFDEKSQAGLHILDCSRLSMYRMTNPKRVYSRFNDIPPAVVQALLFIENRDLLSDRYPKVNPAVDWGRFSKAVLVKAGEAVHINLPSMGGSTLATQTEKFRHSDNGMTSSITDKLIQMTSASIRAYRHGEDTTEYRKQLVLDYVNSVPLSAAPGAGEVNGLGDGMFVWYGTEFDEMNRLLNQKETNAEDQERQAGVLKRVISLMIAHRRPSYYLVRGHTDLAALSNSYVRLLAQNGVISHKLAEIAQTQPLFFRNFRENSAAPQIANNKGVNVVRNRLSSLLDTSLYDLDRMDLTVTTSLNSQLQEQINGYLKSLEDPAVADSRGLIGKYLLTPDQTSALSYSFTLFERTAGGNMVRIQTDTTDLPFDLNEGSKLELGSTAKLRTLATYLEIIAELHAELAALPEGEVSRLLDQRPDTLTRWACHQFLVNPEIKLRSMLEASMSRTYSANPDERFFTGGGVHVFGNFKREDNNRIATVTESLQYSINLPFIRIMNDIVKYTQANQWENNRKILIDDNDPRRREFLDKFIDRESRVFLSRYWNKYQKQTAPQRLETLLAGMKPTPIRLTIVHRYLYPTADETTYIQFVRSRLPENKLTNKQLSAMYERYKPGSYNLQDMGYLASLHPLELWLLDYLQQPGDVSLGDAAEKSADVRRRVYGWLMRTKAKNARDSRIKTVLEIDAFSDIHRRWKNMGYPFEHLVPSLATALGSSGDRPAALSELIGIILNDGKRLPTYRFTKAEFARDTPFETIVEWPSPTATRVLHPEVAGMLKEALAIVVNEGTARRLLNSFQQEDGSAFVIGGKTGTGDNRIIASSSYGQKTSSRALNRTATFVFYLGDNHFGTLTAFVSGRSSNAFSFTSALPLQVLKGMAPILQPYINSVNQQAGEREGGKVPESEISLGTG
jgi:membrane peptidoglycan carboxypeptidase